MPHRSYASTANYRFGFNGKENDNEPKGLGNEQDYGMRIYDTRLGRFLSVDPLSAKYPFYTPYSYSGNKPIQCIDLDGAEEAIPYLQSAAFDQIATSIPGVSYVRGRKGDKLATSLPRDEKNAFDQFLESIAPLQMVPIQPASHISQAINFGNSVGSVVYDYESSQNGEYNPITNGSEALSYNSKTVYLNISGYSEVGQAIVQELRSCHGLKELSDAEVADYISSVKFIFEPGKDYSNLFWKQKEGQLEPQIILNQIGPIALPLPVSTTPVLLPPLGGSANGINSKTGSITVSTDAISQEIAATIAPSILQMAHKKQQSQSSGSTKKGGAKATRHQKGETHGSLSSKKGNRPNPNKRKGAVNRGGKKN